MKALTFVVLALAVTLSAHPKDDDSLLSSFVTSGQFAYYVAPSRLVLDAESVNMFFTPDGRYAVISGLEPPKISPEDRLKSLFDASKAPEPKILTKVWDTENNTLRDASPAIVKVLSAWGQGASMGLEWTSKPGVAITTMDLDAENGARAVTPTTVASGRAASVSHRVGVLKVNLVEGTVNQVATIVTSDSNVSVLPSPTRPFFVVISSETNKPIDRADVKTTIKFQVVDLSGKAIKSGQSVVDGNAYLGDWTENGSDLVGQSVRRSAPGSRAQATSIVLNLTTSVVSATKEDIKTFVPPNVDQPLIVRIVVSPVTNGKSTKNVPCLWISSVTPSEEPTCMVAAEVDKNHWLSPKLNLLAYVSNGRLFASDIVKMDIDEFHKLKALALQREAMSNARQCATAALMYSADCDDLMPLSGTFQDTVLPYVKNQDVMSGFVYTYKGGSLTDLKDPAHTEIGYISVNGGRAVAYADGHVGYMKGP